MTGRKHGGDWAAFERRYGAGPLDFSANVSPLGVPQGVREAIERAAAHADRYPDPECVALRTALAEHEGVSAKRVLCGGGAAELIWRAVFAAMPKRALLVEPCFGEYEAALAESGCALVRHTLREPFVLTERFLEKIDHNIDFIILCNPNNPTGRTVEPSLLRRIIARCEETGTRLVIDECFVGFLDRPERHTLRGMLDDYPHLVILNAFTKLYGMAGVRLGWAISADAAFLNAMRRAGPPWSVSQLAQEAGLAALKEKNYVNQVRSLVANERLRMLAELRGMGLAVIPGEANYLLFRCETPLDAPLRERGILIRCCGDFRGLGNTWYRAAVRTGEENGRLIAALREVLV